jgi:hypothetical protein
VGSNGILECAFLSENAYRTLTLLTTAAATLPACMAAREGWEEGASVVCGKVCAVYRRKAASMVGQLVVFVLPATSVNREAPRSGLA